VRRAFLSSSEQAELDALHREGLRHSTCDTGDDIFNLRLTQNALILRLAGEHAQYAGQTTRLNELDDMFARGDLNDQQIEEMESVSGELYQSLMGS